MLPEAGAFELIFLAAVALIVVGPKDLPVLLRKVGQWTAKMRGLAAEFRASFDEMARQSELDELRKEVEALRTGQFMADAKPDVESHLSDINSHLNGDYWGASSHADPVQMFSDEGNETAALPPPGSRSKPLPTRTRKPAGSSAGEAKAPRKAAGKGAARKAPAKAVAGEAAPAKALTARAPHAKIANAARAVAPPPPPEVKPAAPKPVAAKKPASVKPVAAAKTAAVSKTPVAKKPARNKPAPEAAEI